MAVQRASLTVVIAVLISVILSSVRVTPSYDQPCP
jgi:hypothetical protein